MKWNQFRAPTSLTAALTLLACMWAGAVWADDAAGGLGTVGGENAAKETECSDRKDNDGDGMVDCADHDCASSALCKVGSGPEDSDDKCKDWFDNDGDGLIDCDDPDCEGAGVKVCKGSWKGSLDGAGNGAQAMEDSELPEIKEGQSVEDLIGKGGDKDGERNDEVCSDGIDNDRDGRVDCADFGCRFDPEVTVCRGNPGVRFGVIGRLEAGQYNTVRGSAGNQVETTTYDNRFSMLTLRTFGPTPLVPNSFFLISAHVDGTPRVTFAMFQMPIGKNGHTFMVNSGGASLSTALIIAPSRRLMLEPAFYLTNAFEQPTGAAFEFAGPLLSQGRMNYRVFAAAGAGNYGIIGGLSSTTGNAVTDNFPFNVGVQFSINAIGTLSRWDSGLLYTPVPTTLGFTVGGKYEQRPFERYPVVHLGSVFRSGRFYVKGEAAFKRELDYEANALMYNVEAGVLVWPKHLLIGADFGAFVADDYKTLKVTRTEVNRQRDEQQWRVALHYFLWRQTAMATLLYRDDALQGTPKDPQQRIRELTANLQFRF
jgi:hypothetical protein